jgi:hypothetical protein
LGDVKVYLEGMACIEYDAIHAMYAAFPTAIIATKGSFF